MSVFAYELDVTEPDYVRGRKQHNSKNVNFMIISTVHRFNNIGWKVLF